MLKAAFWTALILLITLVATTGITKLVFDYAEGQARDYCHTLGAEPTFTQNAHALCITPDGRVVGSV